MTPTSLISLLKYAKRVWNQSNPTEPKPGPVISANAS